MPPWSSPHSPHRRVKVQSDPWVAISPRWGGDEGEATSAEVPQARTAAGGLGEEPPSSTTAPQQLFLHCHEGEADDGAREGDLAPCGVQRTQRDIKNWLWTLLVFVLLQHLQYSRGGYLPLHGLHPPTPPWFRRWTSSTFHSMISILQHLHDSRCDHLLLYDLHPSPASPWLKR